MRIPLLLALAQLRRGWRNLAGLTCLIGLAGGLVIAGTAGAQRTATAVDRMIEATEASHVLVNPSAGDETGLDFDRVASLPMVSEFSRFQGVMVGPMEPAASVAEWFSGPFTMTNDGVAGVEFARPVIHAGRMVAATAVGEVFLDRAFAERHQLNVGDEVRWRIPTWSDVDAAFAAGGEQAILEILNSTSFGTAVDLVVVGIGTELDGIAVDTGFEPVSAWLPRGLYDSLGRPSAGFGGALVRLADADDITDFKAAVDQMAPDEKIVYQTLAVSRDKALRATQPAATALAIFAAVAFLLGLLLVGQAISRRAQLDAGDNDVLAALGTTRTDRFAASMIRLTLAAIAGGVMALVIAVLLSAFTPVGPARWAEVDQGMWLPTITMGGALMTALVVVVAGLAPTWRYTRELDHSLVVRGSRVAGWLAAQGAPPPVTTGVRFGLEPGRGRTAVPTRATIIGAMTAVAVAVATIVFAASLDRVVHDGRFYGSNFDVALDFDNDDDLRMGNPSTIADVVSTLSELPEVAQVGEMRISEVVVDNEPLTALTFSASANAVAPTLADGRAPSRADQVALGATTLRQLGVSIGDTVRLRTAKFDGDAEVVGRVVLPGVGLYQGSDRTSIGNGVLLTPDPVGVRDPESKGFIVVKLAPGADRATFEQRASQALGGFGLFQFQSGSRPSEIVSLDQLRSLPLVFAALLVLLVSVTVVHALAVSVRRRRRDLAILQVLGADRRSVIAVGVWQGVTIGVAAVLLGVPVGVVAGRWSWVVLANAFGTLAEPVVPARTVTAVGLAVITLAALAGFVPSRRGLRHHPGTSLRTE